MAKWELVIAEKCIATIHVEAENEEEALAQYDNGQYQVVATEYIEPLETKSVTMLE